MKPKQYYSAIVTFILLLTLAGCASVGKDFASDNIDTIKIGTTTKTDIEEAYGTPWRVGIEDGEETWTYGYYRYKLIGKTKTKDLIVRFGKNGIVSSYTFNRSTE